MNAIATPAVDRAAILADLPAGVAAYDGSLRLRSVNDAYCDVLGLPRGIFQLGSELETNVRLIAMHGVYGPGDPERHVRELLAADRTASTRRRLRRVDGGTFDAHQRPLSDGGCFFMLVDTSGPTQQREQAERTAANLFQVVSNLRAGLAVFDADHRLALHNWRFVDLLGLNGPNLAPGLPLDDVAQAIADQAYADDAGREALAALVARLPDGARVAAVQRLRTWGRVIDLASDPLAGGGWALTATDVTALAQAEEESSRRAAMLEATIQHIPHGITVFGPDGRATMINQTYIDLLEGAPIVVGDHFADIIRRRAAAGEFGDGDVDDIIAERLAFDYTSRAERRRRRPNGAVLDVRTAPLPDGGHISVAMDVTALAEAEAEAIRTAAHMAAMVANVRHGMILWDSERRIVAVNAFAERLLNAPPGLLVPGRRLEETIEAAFDRGNLGAGPERAARAAHLASYDRAMPHADMRFTASGQVLDVRSSPVEGGGFVTTYTDVTEAQRDQSELQRAKLAAEAANVAKSQFLAAVSHELRTPLNAVIGFSDALLRTADDARRGARLGRPAAALDPARVADHARAVQDAGRQLLGIIDDILDVARLDAGRFDLLTDQVDLRRLIEACVRQTATAAAAADIDVAVDLPPGLPHLLADDRRLRQAVLHLLNNAIKFSGEAGGVRIAVRHDDRGLAIDVADNGIGIAPENLERVCEPFTQLDAEHSRRYQGSGLGLYITRAIMRAHDGDLSLASQLGHGTTATLNFPLGRILASRSSQETE